MKTLPFKLAALWTFLFLSGVAQGTTIHFTTLLSGSNEIPANASLGTGTGDVYYDDILHTLQVNLTWANLTGTTSVAHLHAPATAAQIASAVPFNGNWGVATQPGTFTGFPAGTTSGSYTGAAYSLLDTTNYTAGFVTANGGTAASAEAALLSYMLSGKAYLNIHTNAFPGGEIKGYLTVPDNASTAGMLTLVLVALLALPACKRHRLAAQQ